MIWILFKDEEESDEIFFIESGVEFEWERVIYFIDLDIYYIVFKLFSVVFIKWGVIVDVDKKIIL